MNLKTALDIAIILAVLIVAPLVSSAPLMFPLTIGGFDGNTWIDIMMMTPDSKLFIAGESSDSSLVNTVPNGGAKFYAYFDYLTSKDYIWKNQYDFSGG
jgi:hypothetical protein